MILTALSHSVDLNPKFVCILFPMTREIWRGHHTSTCNSIYCISNRYAGSFVTRGARVKRTFESYIHRVYGRGMSSRFSLVLCPFAGLRRYTFELCLWLSPGCLGICRCWKGVASLMYYTSHDDFSWYSQRSHIQLGSPLGSPFTNFRRQSQRIHGSASRLPISIHSVFDFWSL